MAKENVEVRIGEGGRSLTIEGKVVSKGPEPEVTQAQAPEGEQAASTEGMFSLFILSSLG